MAIREFCASQEEIETSRQDPTKSTSEKWMAIFQKIGKENLTNLFLIVSFVLSRGDSSISPLGSSAAKFTLNLFFGGHECVR